MEELQKQIEELKQRMSRAKKRLCHPESCRCNLCSDLDYSWLPVVPEKAQEKVDSQQETKVG